MVDHRSASLQRQVSVPDCPPARLRRYETAARAPSCPFEPKSTGIPPLRMTRIDAWRRGRPLRSNNNLETNRKGGLSARHEDEGDGLVGKLAGVVSVRVVSGESHPARFCDCLCHPPTLDSFSFSGVSV